MRFEIINPVFGGNFDAHWSERNLLETDFLFQFSYISLL